MESTSDVAPSTRRARMQARVVRLQERRDEALDRLEEARKYRVVDFGFTAMDHDRNSGGGLLAGALAYRLFLWLLPLALILVGCLGFVPSESAGKGASGLGLGVLATGVETAAEQAHQARWILLLFGLGTLYWASSGLARSLWVATLLAWQLPMRRLVHKPRAAGLVTAVFGTAALAALAAGWVRSVVPLWGIAATVLLVLVYCVIGWVTLWLLPHPEEVSFWGLLPGAVVIGVLVQVLHLVTVFYLPGRMTNEVYGVLGGSATLLLWGYLLARILIGASTVNRTWHTRPLVVAPTGAEAFFDAWQGGPARPSKHASWWSRGEIEAGSPTLATWTWAEHAGAARAAAVLSLLREQDAPGIAEPDGTTWATLPTGELAEETRVLGVDPAFVGALEQVASVDSTALVVIAPAAALEAFTRALADSGGTELRTGVSEEQRAGLLSMLGG